MTDRICIGVAEEPPRARDMHSPQHETTPFDQTVNVVSNPDSLHQTTRATVAGYPAGQR